MGEIVNLAAEDGFRLSGYRAAPAGKPRAGLVIVQEIFGVNGHISAKLARQRTIDFLRKHLG